MEIEFLGGRGTQEEKLWKFQGMWEYCEALWNRKSWGVGSQMEKTHQVWMFSEIKH